MEAQIALQRVLLSKYEEMRSRNPQFSRRAFSRRLGVSPGAISELFNGQRRVSARFVERLAPRLGLDPLERAELFALFPKKVRRAKPAIVPTPDPSPSFLQLSADQFRMMRDWYHFAILTLMRTQGFVNDPAWVAARLGLPAAEAERALERMKRMGILTEKDGCLERNVAPLRTTDDVPSEAVRAAHEQYIDKAGDALRNLPVEQRDFTSIMMAVNPERMARAKEMIRRFQTELAAEMETGDKSQVYQLLVQLFPLSKYSSGEQV